MTVTHTHEFIFTIMSSPIRTPKVLMCPGAPKKATRCSSAPPMVSRCVIAPPTVSRCDDTPPTVSRCDDTPTPDYDDDLMRKQWEATDTYLPYGIWLCQQTGDDSELDYLGD